MTNLSSIVKPMYSTLTSTSRRDGLLRRQAVRRDFGARARRMSCRYVKGQARVDDVLDDDHVPPLEAGVDVLEQANLAGRPRAVLITRHGDEIERDAGAHRPHQVGHEHESALEHADEMDFLVGRIAGFDLGSELDNPTLDLRCGDEDVHLPTAFRT